MVIMLMLFKQVNQNPNCHQSRRSNQLQSERFTQKQKIRYVSV
jgi:hypothetical protein